MMLSIIVNIKLSFCSTGKLTINPQIANAVIDTTENINKHFFLLFLHPVACITIKNVLKP
jgi:hypothetical protein